MKVRFFCRCVDMYCISLFTGLIISTRSVFQGRKDCGSESSWFSFSTSKYMRKREQETEVATVRSTSTHNKSIYLNRRRPAGGGGGRGERKERESVWERNVDTAAHGRRQRTALYSRWAVAWKEEIAWCYILWWWQKKCDRRQGRFPPSECYSISATTEWDCVLLVGVLLFPNSLSLLLT